MMDAASSRDSFDMQAASTLFWDVVPVSLLLSDRKDVSEMKYMFRVLLGQRNDGKRTPVLRAYVFNDADPHFLQALEVNEDDFQTLKAEQGILVDFKNFSGKITDLLQQCIAAQDECTPRFRAVLYINESDTQLKLVETNEFKQIPHICLSFRSGSDSDIKSFLAFRLGELKRERDSLVGKLSSTCSLLDAAKGDVETSHRQLRALESSHKRLLMEASAEAKDMQAAAHHELVKQREDLLCAHEREKSRLRQSHVQEVNAILKQKVDIEEHLKEVREGKYMLEQQLTEMLHKCSGSETMVTAMQEDSRALRERVQELLRHKVDIELEHENLRIQLTALAETKSSQEQSVRQHQNQAEKLDGVMKHQAKELQDIRQGYSHLEFMAVEASEEVAKGNQIIHDLTTDLKVMRDKLKRKHEIVARQEEKMTKMGHELKSTVEMLKESQNQVTAMQHSLEQMENTENNLTNKLRICKEQLAGNEQMIRWLNSQVLMCSCVRFTTVWFKLRFQSLEMSC